MSSTPIDWTTKRCQETYGMIGDDYMRCLKPAVMLVQHRRRDEGPYYMCLECGDHNAFNRNAEVLALHPDHQDLRERYKMNGR